MSSTASKHDGQVAYEAYCQSTNFCSAVSGAPLPHWDDMHPAIMEAWMEAGNAVRRRIEDPYVTRHVVCSRSHRGKHVTYWHDDLITGEWAVGSRYEFGDIARVAPFMLPEVVLCLALGSFSD